MGANRSRVAFGISYAWTATRFAWGISLAVAFSSYLIAVACLTIWSPPVLMIAPTVLAALIVAGPLFPTSSLVVAPSTSSNDIVLRMGTGALLVITLTHFSSELGPQLSGLLAMFPIMSSILAVFSHRHSGAGFAIKLLRGTVLGYFAFATFCFALSLSLPVTGIGGAFSISLACAAIVQAISRIYLLRNQQVLPLKHIENESLM